MLSVGQTIRTGTPQEEFLSSLERLIKSPEVTAQLGGVTHDERMPSEAWNTLLRFELLLLYQWALRRQILSAKEGRTGGVSGDAEQILVLLPGYGFALHALRRAVPFPALGLRTVISVPTHLLGSARGPLLAIVKALGLETAVVLSDEEPAKLVAKSVQTDFPIFLTGRKSTFEMLKSQHPSARLFAATGTCSVVVSSDANALTSFERAQDAHKLSVSCSSRGLSVVCNRISDDAVVASAWGAEVRTGSRGRLVDEIVRVHPSIVLVVEENLTLDIPTELAGYIVWRCTKDGVPTHRDGFGRDPIGGWRGDYCV